MFGILDVSGKCIIGCGLALSLFASIDGAQAASYKLLYSFKGGSDGAGPQAALIKDKAGNLYGTTTGGGANNSGTIFKLAPDGTESVLYSFCSQNNCSDGADPKAALIKDRAGNLYGTTAGGGAHSGGTVFKLAPDGTESVLYSFCSQTNCSDGTDPQASLIRDRAGNLYGTTVSSDSNGTVFRLAPDGTETVLHSFTGGSDGAAPAAGLIMDRAGNLYGTTVFGGGDSNGTVFRLTRNGTLTVLYAFPGSGVEGFFPFGILVRDSAGNLYGTTKYGGTGGCTDGDFNGCGTVYKVAPDGTETVLHSFMGRDGSTPEDGVIRDKLGNLYGTTLHNSRGFGSAFQLAPGGTITLLHTFFRSDGNYPAAGLLKDKKALYGTTSMGGANNGGIVFEIDK